MTLRELDLSVCFNFDGSWRWVLERICAKPVEGGTSIGPVSCIGFKWVGVDVYGDMAETDILPEVPAEEQIRLLDSLEMYVADAPKVRYTRDQHRPRDA